MTQEALKLTLEYMNEYYPSYAKQAAHHHKVTTAIKEALAQPEQEPVAWITQGGKGWLRWHKSYDDNKDSVPLYTTPPQRTWVGLDDDELTEAWHWGGCEPHIEGAHFKALYQYFEAKLKDKNHVAQKTD